mgnify:CR=1 FL=1
MKNKTLVLGATTNPERYAYLAVNRLVENGHEVIPVGIKKGDVSGIKIVNEKRHFEDVDTVTLYLSVKNQKEYYDYILALKPRRVIFNPGTHNQELIDKLKREEIEVVEACTLVMLSANNY